MRWRHIVLIALPLAAGCTARDRIRLETSLATTLVSPAEERALGEEIHAELERQGVRWVRDPRVRAYVEAATARVLATVRRTEAVKTVHVHVIDAPGVLQWLSSHPTPADRVERLRAVINARGWAGGETGEVSQRVIRRRLRERATGS